MRTHRSYLRMRTLPHRLSSTVIMRSSDGRITHFSPQQSLKWYACGPTVYEHSHLGHARAYIHADIIRRVLTQFFHMNIVFAMGITDIDDKIIARLRFPSLQSLQDLTKAYEDSFFEDMRELQVLPPQVILRVSEHISEIIHFIERLIDLNRAYVSGGDVYFDGRDAENYARFGKLPGEPDDPPPLGNKRHFRDFALWKAAKANEPSWESPWGEGRPGWHIGTAIFR